MFAYITHLFIVILVPLGAEHYSEPSIGQILRIRDGRSNHPSKKHGIYLTPLDRIHGVLPRMTSEHTRRQTTTRGIFGEESMRYPRLKTEKGQHDLERAGSAYAWGCSSSSRSIICTADKYHSTIYQVINMNPNYAQVGDNTAR